MRGASGTETEDAIDRTTPEGAQPRVALTRLVEPGAVVVFGVSWVAFWGPVARLHVRTGHPLSAAVGGGFLVLPAVGWLGHYFQDPLPVDPSALPYA